MPEITYTKLTEQNFHDNSLDDFIRHQQVTECWRRANGKMELQPVCFVEDWDIAKRRSIAGEILSCIKDSGFAYGAFSGGVVVGYICVSDKRFGSEGQYIELTLFHVSEPFRRMGIGQELFRLACAQARKLGAKKLYISAHSSKESIYAYRRFGCVEAEEINHEIAENEPYDIQMEYRL
ncbi:MAG: GNAT family N-acetyltransferase [Oscillospiraceae bacterium]